MPTYNAATHTIAWSGTPAAQAIVTISFQATITTAATRPIVNTARLTRNSVQKNITALLIANPRLAFLPLARR